MTATTSAKPKFLEAAFGGKKGFVQLCQSMVALRTGRYRAWQDIDLPQVNRLVFVCSGNISRSPYSASRAQELGLLSASFGLHAGTGNAAESSARRNASSRGLDLSAHRSTPIEHYQPDAQDLLLAYEPGHAIALEQHCNRAAGARPQISLLGLWARPQRPLVFDPYDLHDDYYQTCYAVIDAAIENLMLQLQTGVPESAL